jgi:protein gp37
MTATRIPWATDTWNPWTGCTKLSEGCRNCYAERHARRHLAGYEQGFKLTVHPERFDQPLRWRKPRLVFVCSMSDFFHPLVPINAHDAAWNVMASLPQHTFLLLTKRPELVPVSMHIIPWPQHIWLGVTVESPETVWRIREANRVPAAHRFVSFEPLLAPVRGVLAYPADWIIIGAESGPGRRPCELQWVRDLVEAAKHAGVPTFVKQLDLVEARGARMRHRLSKHPDEWPAELRAQQFPAGLPVPGKKPHA